MVFLRHAEQGGAGWQAKLYNVVVVICGIFICGYSYREMLNILCNVLKLLTWELRG